MKFIRNQNIKHSREDTALRYFVKRRKFVDEKPQQNCNKNQDQNEGGNNKDDMRHRIALGFFQMLFITLLRELKVHLFCLQYMEIAGQLKLWQSRLHRVRGGKKNCHIVTYVLNQQKQYIISKEIIYGIQYLKTIRENQIKNINRTHNEKLLKKNTDIVQSRGNINHVYILGSVKGITSSNFTIYGTQCIAHYIRGINWPLGEVKCSSFLPINRSDTIFSTCTIRKSFFKENRTDTFKFTRTHRPNGIGLHNRIYMDSQVP